MKYEPYDYQRRAIDFIKQHPSTALLLDMGLGKTVITLTAFYEMRRDGMADRLLVVAPKRVAEITWPDEIANWDHLKDMRISVIKGDVKHRKKAIEADADIYIVSRDNVGWMAKEDICPPCDMLAIDEMSSFKSPTSVRTKSMIQMRPKFHRVVGLSGTPAPNGWTDLWSQYRIVDNGFVLGNNYWAFINTHFTPAKTVMRGGRLTVVSYAPLPGHEEIMERAIMPITLSMKAFGHIKLPGITFSKVQAEMNDKERAQYDELAQNLKGYVGNEKMKIPTDEALVGKLVQLANGQVYTEAEAEDTDENGNETVVKKPEQTVIQFHRHKLDILIELLETNEGRNMLVVYWFKADFILIKKTLEDAGIAVADLADQKACRDWNDGKLRVGLIHPMKAGHGLNFQRGGSMIVWYTLQWNLELYQQTNARLYRNGQKEHVSVVHIMTKDTIDDAIYGALMRKKKLQDRLFERTSEDWASKGLPDPDEIGKQLTLNFGNNDNFQQNRQQFGPLPQDGYDNPLFVYRLFDPRYDVLPPVRQWTPLSKTKWTSAWQQ